MDHFVGTLLAINRQLDEADEIVDVNQVSSFFARAPYENFAIATRHRLGDSGAQNMAAFQIELVVRSEDVGMPDDRMPRNSEPAEELAHLLDVDFGPARTEIAEVHLLRGVPLLLSPRCGSRLIHDRTAEKDEMTNLVIVAGAQKQRVHD